jgi:hexosaminidase
MLQKGSPMNAVSLLPTPQEVRFDNESYQIVPGRRIVLAGAEPPALLFAARRLQDALRRHAGAEWELAASPAGPPEEIGALLRVAPERAADPQGYELVVGASGIQITAGGPAGVFYGICTLIQMLEQAGGELPGVRIVDRPDFAVRGVMLDISRDKVPTMATLLELVDTLASWKVNQLQLYVEHTFAYRAHAEVWAQASPITGDDILLLDQFCRERFVELVPNQNSFGHMHRWLRHTRYAPLAEVRDGFSTPWGWRPGSFSLAAVNPGSLELLRGMYDELLPHFSSRLFNVGLDETFDLGQGQSKEACEQLGVGRVYLDFLHKVYAEVRARDHTMQFWGDIIIKHPELIGELPADAIAMEWGYEADHPFATNCPQFAAAGIPFYVCPGTSSWCSLAGRTDNALGNLRGAAEHGLRNGAVGFLNTDWGDLGHWQPLPVSYLGLLAGAAYSWAFDANRDRDIAAALDVHAFHDSAGVMGRLAYDLGNVYRSEGLQRHNSSVLFWVLQWPAEQLRANAPREAGSSQVFDLADAAIERAVAGLAGARMQRPDAALVSREFALAAAMMHHAGRRARFVLAGTGTGAELDRDMAAMLEEYRAVWLARNRPGGLADSAGRLEGARQDYR